MITAATKQEQHPMSSINAHAPVQPSVSGYWNIKRLSERFCKSRRTIFRWMKREKLPFPKPRLPGAGSDNLWAIEDVLAWEHARANAGIDALHTQQITLSQ
jgi:predicted DNA-binding transcriptional regulator AlpA